jgi:hypothetical protein
MALNEAQRHFAENPVAEMLDDAAIEDLNHDPDGMEAFLRKWYLDGFVDQGFGKVKFVQGRAGSGKTHFLRHLTLALRADHYQAILINAQQHRLAAIEELYRVVAQEIPWADLVGRATVHMIQEELGYQEFSGNAREIWTWAEQYRGRSPSSLHSDIRDASDRWVRNLGMDARWAAVIRQWMMRNMEPGGAENPLYERWLKGEKTSPAEKRDLSVSINIDRRNARAMLISLASFCHAAGYRGLALLIDNGQVMALRNRQDAVPYYTRMLRDQAYEMWRELIDDSHHAAYLFILLAGSPPLFEDAKLGFPSYPALWARLQSEISMAQVNRFSDLIDWDRLWLAHKETLDDIIQIWRSRNFQGVQEPTQTGDVHTQSLDWSVVKRRIARELQETLKEER